VKVTRIVDFLLNITSADTDTGTDTDTNEVMQKPKRTFGTASFGTLYRELAAVPTEFKYFS
jgi:tRNA nucleotidyltransferase/poly(A) polymerase